MSASNCAVELGFLEKVESWKLQSKHYPSKIGGYPAWLNLDELPAVDKLHCHCSRLMAFLCQIYAPAEKEECFHRTVFVFLCRNPECSRQNSAANIRVFRCHLCRANKFYNYHPVKMEFTDCSSPCAEDYGKLCRVCGCSGPKFCGGCRKAHYCSKEHQALDWKSGHNKECKTADNISALDSPGSKHFLFPEYEIDMEPEEVSHVVKTNEEVMKEYEEILKGGNTNQTLDDEEEALAKLAVKETDKQFQRFRTRIKDYPDQVIRYDRGGEPLLVSSSNKPSNIPPCICGEERTFEFQIMPQLLVHLKVDAIEHSIDWGTILIYTCPKDCTEHNSSYVEEYAFKQDYSAVSDVMAKRP